MARISGSLSPTLPVAMFGIGLTVSPVPDLPKPATT